MWSAKLPQRGQAILSARISSMVLSQSICIRRVPRRGFSIHDSDSASPVNFVAMGRCRLSLLKGADDLSGESRCVVREANSPWEDPRVATQPEAGPIGSPSLWRWLLLFVAAMAPLIAVAALRGPLDLPNAVVGVGVLLWLLLAATVTATDLLASRPVGSRRYLSFLD